MLVVRVGIEAGGYISSDCLGGPQTTDGAVESQA